MKYTTRNNQDQNGEVIRKPNKIWKVEKENGPIKRNSFGEGIKSKEMLQVEPVESTRSRPSICSKKFILNRFKLPDSSKISSKEVEKSGEERPRFHFNFQKIKSRLRELEGEINMSSIPTIEKTIQNKPKVEKLLKFEDQLRRVDHGKRRLRDPYRPSIELSHYARSENTKLELLRYSSVQKLRLSQKDSELSSLQNSHLVNINSARGSLDKKSSRIDRESIRARENPVLGLKVIHKNLILKKYQEYKEKSRHTNDDRSEGTENTHAHKNQYRFSSEKRFEGSRMARLKKLLNIYD